MNRRRATKMRQDRQRTAVKICDMLLRLFERQPAAMSAMCNAWEDWHDLEKIGVLIDRYSRRQLL